MSKTAHNSRPEIQARKIADYQNPEYLRRRAMYDAAKGYKRDRIRKWNLAWNVAGRPRDFPDFPEWDAVNKPAMDAQRAADRAFQEHINAKHAEWVAAGMPGTMTERGEVA